MAGEFENVFEPELDPDLFDIEDVELEEFDEDDLEEEEE